MRSSVDLANTPVVGRADCTRIEAGFSSDQAESYPGCRSTGGLEAENNQLFDQLFHPRSCAPVTSAGNAAVFSKPAGLPSDLPHLWGSGVFFIEFPFLRFVRALRHECRRADLGNGNDVTSDVQWFVVVVEAEGTNP